MTEDGNRNNGNNRNEGQQTSALMMKGATILVQEIAEHMGIELGKSTVTRFSDGETSVSIWESEVRTMYYSETEARNLVIEAGLRLLENKLIAS